MVTDQLDTIILVVMVFLLAGFIKGVIGFGLPTISVSLLTVVLGLEAAMVIMLLPSLLTNVWQGGMGGHLRYLVRRLWPILIPGVVFTWVTSTALTIGPLPIFVVLLGVAILIYSGSSLVGLKVPDPGERERWLSPVIGSVSGAIGGVTGIFVMPAVDYLRALGLTRGQLIQAMGIWFTMATLGLGGALGHHGLLTGSLGLLSGVGIVPAFVGMMIGQRLRTRLSPEVFRVVLLSGLCVLGFYFIVTGFIS